MKRHIGFIGSSALAVAMMAANTDAGSAPVPDPKFAPIDADERDIPTELADLRTRVSSLETRELPGEFDASALTARIDELEKAHAAQLEYNRSLEDEIASYRQAPTISADSAGFDAFLTHIAQTYFREDYMRYMNEKNAVDKSE